MPPRSFEQTYWGLIVCSKLRGHFVSRDSSISARTRYTEARRLGVSFTEETNLDPRSPYAASKAAADHLVSAYANTFGISAIILRCTNNYGPYQFPEKLIPLMIANARENKPLPIYGDGMQERDWLFVEDYCRAIALARTKAKLVPSTMYQQVRRSPI